MNKKYKIAFYAPTKGNGGIVSWANRYKVTFLNDKFEIYQVDSTLRDRMKIKSKALRMITGFFDSINTISKLSKLHKKQRFDLVHATTSGGNGIFRDILVSKWCRRNKIPCILHCHYGNIPYVLSSKGKGPDRLIKSLSGFNQIWILDNKTEEALKSYPVLKSKLKIVPNNIEVTENQSIQPKEYLNWAFIANLIPSKGILEAVEGVVKSDLPVNLHIAGPDNFNIIPKIKEIAGNKWDSQIKYYGCLSNNDAMDLINRCDGLILPTYYSGEAFPISILEAMKYGKLVMSTDRAAIGDMLTANDNSKCGVIIKPKSSDSIADALKWVLSHKDESDRMCRKAYEKVFECYRTEVVYRLCEDNYKELLHIK